MRDRKGRVSNEAALRIADRYNRLLVGAGLKPVDRIDIATTIYHVDKRYKLDLVKLATMPDYDFSHDISGMEKYVDRSAGNEGKLTECFRPRCGMEK